MPRIDRPRHDSTSPGMIQSKVYNYMGQEPRYRAWTSRAMWYGSGYGPCTRAGTTLPGYPPVPPPRVHPTSGSSSRTVTGPHEHEERVLWALNKDCVTLYSTLRSIWSRLSDVWLLFKAHVARITCFRRPQPALVYPIHLRFYQESVHYPNENVT